MWTGQYRTEEGSGWRSAPPLKWWVRLLLGTAALLLFVVAAFGTQSPWERTAFALCGVAICLLVWLPERARLRPYFYDGSRGTGLALPFHPMLWRMVVALVLLAVLSIGAGMWGVWVMVDCGIGGCDPAVGAWVSDLNRYGWRFLVVSPIFVPVGVSLLIAAVRGLRSQFDRERLVLLGPEGVLLAPWGGGGLRIPWDDLQAVRLRWTRVVGRGSDTVSNGLAFNVASSDRRAMRSPWYFRSRSPRVALHLCAVHPRLAFALLRHYQQNPQDRHELATKGSIARIEKLPRRVRKLLDR